MPLEVRTGSMFDSDAEVYVNPVNTMGVSGAGLAKHFAQRFPDGQKMYEEACQKGLLDVGKIYPVIAKDVYKGTSNIVVYFPTKRSWMKNSELSYVRDGLVKLRRWLLDFYQTPIAVPALGCGLGGLDWNEVKPLIIEYLGDLPETSVYLYEPKGTR